MPYSSFRPLYLCIFASVRVTQTSKAMQTTAIRTVAKSLPQNKVILLTCLISNSYIPYTDLLKFSASQTTFAKDLRKNSQKKYFQIVIMRPKGTASV